jgi:uncharacterized phage infection (PIP) family protein YhgE
MKILRRFLGIFVMVAGLVGLLLSLAGLVGMWAVRPVVEAAITSTVATLDSSIGASQQTMVITNQALAATVDSVDALSAILSTTADSVKDTQPVLAQMNTVMGEQLPATLQSTIDSLKASQEAAKSLESAIQSLDTFRMVMGGVPGVGAFLPASQSNYAPEKPLADALGEVADSLNTMPDTFIEMADNMDKADDNLDAIEANLNTMSGSVGEISDSLREYQTMIGQSQSSLEDLHVMLVNIQTNLDRTMNGVMVVLYLLFFWMLAAQVVIFSQGWELFQGTAGRMESGTTPSTPATAE